MLRFTHQHNMGMNRVIGTCPWPTVIDDVLLQGSFHCFTNKGPQTPFCIGPHSDIHGPASRGSKQGSHRWVINMKQCMIIKLINDACCKWHSIFSPDSPWGLCLTYTSKQHTNTTNCLKTTHASLVLIKTFLWQMLQLLMKLFCICSLHGAHFCIKHP